MNETLKTMLMLAATAVIGAFGGAIFINQGDVLSLYADENATLRIEIDQKNIKITELQKQLIEVKSELARYRINVDLEDPVIVVREVLESLTIPAWAKEARELEDANGNPITFTMLILNQSYSNYYNIPESAYKGRTDFEVWPADVAQNFWENDYIVYSTGRPLDGTELWPADNTRPEGRKILRRISKARMELPYSQRVLLIGYVFETNLPRELD